MEPVSALKMFVHLDFVSNGVVGSGLPPGHRNWSNGLTVSAGPASYNVTLYFIHSTRIDIPAANSVTGWSRNELPILIPLRVNSRTFACERNQVSVASLTTVALCVTVPGPCDPEDLIDGIIFAANYLGSTQLLSDKTPSKNVRMMQAQEAVSRIKAPEGESQPMTEVDLFISTQRIKVLNADTQETMMDHPLRTISYIADIGNIVVLMARRRMPRSNSQENVEASHPSQDGKRQYKMICHVFESEDAQLIAQSIGQAFSVAYQEFLRANGINPEDLSQKEYSDLLNTQDMYNDDLIHFSKSENCKDVFIEKQKGEILGVVIVESGWGSILPTVIIANMMHGGPAEKSGKLNIGDQIMSINGTSLVGLPLSTCQSIIKVTGDGKNQPLL
ncbi:hypothetical protein EI555_005500 [Monodon monoceros]|uniref:Amyloid beta precursor protein binding family A member 1 n=1 Tax=Monodon monoceros TaxID=40151 RepID=A0A4U1ED02_MONMO|nr:hypothetical protein EI555_005500 [Monodon monoceros]